MIQALILLLLAMLSIQYGASLAKGLFSEVGAAGLTTLRVCFSAIILLALIRPWSYRLNKNQILPIALYGLSLGLMNLTFYFALERIPLGIAVALEFVGPLGVAFYNSRKASHFLWASLATLGILLLTPLSSASGHLNPWGVFWALTAGIFWALYIVFGQRAGKDLPSSVTTAYGMSFAALAVILPGLFINFEQITQLKFLPMGVAIALLSSAIPYSFEMKALKALPPLSFGILMSLEPAMATIMGILFLEEFLNPTQTFAILLIIGASAGVTFTQKASGVDVDKQNKLN